jgi:hypothetical protein
MSDTLLELLGREIGRLLEPLGEVADHPELLDRLLASVGRSTPEAKRAALFDALAAIASLRTQLQALLEQSPNSLDDISEVLDIARNTFKALRALDAVVGSSEEFSGFGRDLADKLLTSYLFNWHPLLRSIASLVGVETLAEDAEPIPPLVLGDQLVRAQFSVDRFHFNRLKSLLRDPADALRDEYGSLFSAPDEMRAMADTLFPRIERVLMELGVPCRYGLSPDDEPFLGDTGPFLEHALIVYADDIVAGAEAEAGVVVTISPADLGDLGFVFHPFGTLTSQRHAGPFVIELEVTAGVNVVAYGRQGVTLLADSGTAEFGGHVSATLTPPSDEPAFILGSPLGSRLEVGGALIEAKTSLSEARQSLTLSADVSKSSMVIAPGDGDGFLSRVLPAEGVRADFDLGLAWSNEHGLSFRGTVGLDSDLPVGFALGGLSIPSIHLALNAGDSNVTTEVSVNVSATIGPLVAVINRVGLTAVLSFPEDGGNLGVADLDFRFKSPSGIGLVVDAEVVKGGGFLAVTATGDYFGALELTIKEMVSVKAIGVIGTKMPDGSRGFSFVAIITVSDFPGINLGFGFRLTGVGGIIGIDRTFDFDKLEQGLKQGALRNLLFPPNPVANATAILADITQVFPAARDHHVFGLMFRIVWGSENLVTIDLAAIITDTIAILGIVDVYFPRFDFAQVEFHVHVIGLLDLGGKRIFVHAEILNTSQIFGFKVSGGAAMLVSWGDDPVFILSFGGFNKRYEPHLPAGFPALDRLTVQLLNSKNLKATLRGYLAVTSNSLQFGGSFAMKAGVGKFTIEGSLTVDALLQFHGHPKFIFDLDAWIELKAWGVTLFSVHVEGTLSGGRPWHARGSASFKIWIFHCSVDFDEVWGDPPDDEILPEIDVRSLLLEAFQDVRNWTAELPRAAQGLVTLREPTDGSRATLHPLSALAITQRVAPLNVSLTRFGNAKPQGQNLFTIESISVGVSNTTGGTFSFTLETVGEHFARSQFLDMTEDEKLESPAFEKMDCGVRLVSAPVQYDDPLVVSISYQTWRYNAATKSLEPVEEVSETVPQHLLATGAAASGPSAAYARTPAPAVKILPLEYVVANVNDQSPVTEARAATYTQAVELMNARVAAREIEKTQAQVLEVIR